MEVILQLVRLVPAAVRPDIPVSSDYLEEGVIPRFVDVKSEACYTRGAYAHTWSGLHYLRSDGRTILSATYANYLIQAL